MTRSVLGAMPGLIGSQQPRVELVPEGSEHPDLVAAQELVEEVGLSLYPWQERVFRALLLQDPLTRKYAAFRGAINCPRQNGKNEILLALELSSLFILNDRLIVHSAHLTDTSLEAFRRLRDIVEGFDWLKSEVRSIRATNGQEGIELKNGSRIRFRTRTKGGGRGFTGDKLIFDEAMDINAASHAALVPIVAARPNPQLIYAGSAVDQLVHEHGIVFARIREDAMKGDDPHLAYWEWSADVGAPEDVADPENPEHWARANPSLGILISPEYVENEMHALDHRGFVVERLGVGDYPRTDGSGDLPFDLEQWDSLTDKKSQIASGLFLAFDVSPDRKRSSIAAGGRRSDKLLHLELIERRTGTDGLVERIVELNQKHNAVGVLCDARSPAASLIHELQPHGVQVTALTADDHANACGLLVDLVSRDGLRHLGQPELLSSIRGAATRALSDRFAWARKNSNADITPLCSVTFAGWAANQHKPTYRAWSVK